MSPADLATAGLQANDVVLDPDTGYFDHLPLVVDLLVPGAPQQYTLTLNVVGCGSITSDPDQDTYSDGETVTPATDGVFALPTTPATTTTGVNA